MKISIEPLIETTISMLMPGVHGANVLDYCQRIAGETWAGYIDGKLVCCWALTPPTVFSNTAYLWMHHLDNAGHEFAFIRRSQIEVQKMLARYPNITGHCEIGNLKAAKWLRWLGAEFGPPSNGQRPFVIRRPS